ncbi:hypothetical protein J7363_17545 [Phaeobacter italicus]|uniref:hypothetical protein n=1 Tax=Phaeobacter italicus TaxID=481446 RepID=UPI001ADB0022|nr:hypothetical protein [Phaeobacter italicus]MBO9443897.1 hypothetical protein [Phaeobacter italicus]
MPIARHLSLITLDGVKDLITRKVDFTCRYELVGGTGDGKPLYQCIYSVGDEELLLVAAKVQKHGPKVRHFALWPGLVNHHTNYGDGRPVSLDLDIRNAPESDGGPDGDQS